MSRRRVVFVDPVSADRFQAFAAEQGWLYEGGVGPTDTDPEEYIWLPDNQSQVHWIDDPVLHLVYALVVAPDPYLLEGQIRLAFDAHLIDEAVEQFKDAIAWPDRVIAVALLAAVAPEQLEDQAFSALALALQDSNEHVRRMAVLGVFYAPWSAFVPALAVVATSDPDASVAELAGAALTCLLAPDAVP